MTFMVDVALFVLSAFLIVKIVMLCFNRIDDAYWEGFEDGYVDGLDEVNRIMKSTSMVKGAEK